MYACKYTFTAQTHIHTQGQPNKSAAEMAPNEEMPAWRFCVQSVEFIATTIKIKE